MNDRKDEAYNGQTNDSNEIEISFESAPTVKTGDTEGEIIIEKSSTHQTKRPKMKTVTPQGAPKKKKTGVIIAAVLVVFLLFGCMGGGGSDDTDTTADSTTSDEVVTEEPTAEETEEPAKEEKEEPAPVDEYDSWTSEQQHAYKAGLNYLDYKGFSKQGLIDQLSSEYGDGYPVEVAEFAVNKIEERGEVDWVEQAKRSAQDYLDFSDFSKQGLIDQLSSPYGDQYTVEQATEAVEAVY